MASTKNNIQKSVYRGECNENFQCGEAYNYGYIEKVTGIPAKILVSRFNRHRTRNHLKVNEFSEALLLPVEERTPFVVTSVCETSMEKLSAYWLRQKLCH